MLTRSAKAKGRRLQTQVAEILSERFALNIEATPPTKAGYRANGSFYVSELEGGDLKVRRMGEGGADVALISNNAKKRFGQWWIECKNTEAWTFDAGFWRTGESAVVEKAILQVMRDMPPLGWRPLIILGKNRWEPLAVWEETSEERKIINWYCPVHLKYGNYSVVSFKCFVKMIDKEMEKLK